LALLGIRGGVAANGDPSVVRCRGCMMVGPGAVLGVNGAGSSTDDPSLSRADIRLSCIEIGREVALVIEADGGGAAAAGDSSLT
jgi:hypothetical protein